MAQETGSTTKLTHDDAFALLPWYVNESLAETEAPQVHAHVADCAVCQQEIATLNSMLRAVATSNETLPEPAPEMLDRVLNRIDDYGAARAGRARAESTTPRWSARLNAFWLALFPWRRVAMAGQFVALLLLAVAIVFTAQRARRFEDQAARERLRADHNEQLLKETEQRYETLVGPNRTNGAQGARLNVAFQEHATEKEIRDLLNDINATIISGPSPQRIYVIALSAARGPDRQRLVTSALTQLRAKPRVVLFAADQPEQMSAP